MKRFAALMFVIALLAFLAVWDFAPRAAASKSPKGARTEADAPSFTREGSQPVASQTPTTASREEAREEDDPDISPKLGKAGIDKSEYQRMRDEYDTMRRGVDPNRPFDLLARGRAINFMEQQQRDLIEQARKEGRPTTNAFGPPWVEIGPAPIPNGQYQGGLIGTVTGRVTSIAVDSSPTGAGQKIYLGTAQGGVWRSLDGGSTWTPIFDIGQSLAIGAIALAPSNPSILFVGTGEANNSGDSFFGIGMYRIDNVDTTPILHGPINPTYTYVSSGTGNPTVNGTVFTGRGITKILVDPTNPNNIFVSTASAVAGQQQSGATPSATVPPLAMRGVWRSTNALDSAGEVRFTKMPLAVASSNCFDVPCTANASVFDIAMEPGFGTTSQTVLAFVTGFTATAGSQDGGVFRSTNALAPTPTFTQTAPFTSGLRGQFAVHKDTGTSVVTVYLATSETPSGTCGTAGQAGKLYKSTDGGVTFPTTLTAANGFCGGQCTYDMPIGVNPNDVNKIYLGGNARGTCSDVLKQSSNGGTTFSRDDNGLHADSHAITFDTTNPAAPVVLFGTDGGVWKRPDSPPNTAWASLNNAPLGTVQFQSVAVHPIDRNFTIGGTQDNGTEAQQADRTWTSAEGGDGGYALIDQSSPTVANTTMYHTFYNQSNSQILFDRAELASCLAVKNSWETRGQYAASSSSVGADDPTPSCDGTPFFKNNGINVADNVLFYAPMALGPGTPNVLYFGTDRLYRSTDRGDTMTVVGQNPIIPTGTRTPPGGVSEQVGVQISAIGISPQNDNVRVLGMVNGQVWATITGGNYTNISSASFPANANGSGTKFISEVVVDPNNQNVAYVAFSFFTNPASQGVWKTTNLNNTGVGTVTWTLASTGLPNVPIDSMVIDPANSNNVFAGTDIGVYGSTDGGATWQPYGNGLPRVAIYDMAIQNTNRVLRVATHGRGMWETAVATPTATRPQVSGRVLAPDGSPLGGVVMTINGSSTTQRFTVTDSEGRYSFPEMISGDLYTVSPALANYSFSPSNRSFTLKSDVTDATFTGSPNLVFTANALDTNEFFVRQQYIDFLGREPDQGGLEYWTSQLGNCNGDEGCLRSRRIGVSAAFFMELEYKETGFFVYRLYKASLGRSPRYAEFTPDRNRVVAGADLETNKQALINDWVQRPAFLEAYPAMMSNADFVNKLFDTAGIKNNADERASYIAVMNSGATRSQVIRNMIEGAAFKERENNPSFVLMQYFGYLKRDPEPEGFDFWLNVLNNKEPNNYRGMVCSFITSAEYQKRFSSVVTHTNQECGQ